MNCSIQVDVLFPRVIFKMLDVESEEDQQKFYEVDAFGDDYLDFGAITGPKGSFSWHANYPLE